jgi:ribosome-associated protein
MTLKKTVKKAQKQSLPPLDSAKRLLLCVNAILERKAHNIVVLQVSEFSSFADYLIICTGTSDRQVQAISSTIRENLKKAGILPLGVEGEPYGQWILMDFDDVIIHIFYEPVRSLYQIERIWTEVPRMEIGRDVIKLGALSEEMWH